MSPISIVGAGQVGVVSAVCLAERGHNVIVVDKNKGRIKLLAQGKAPFHEPGLDDLLKRSVSRITFTTKTATAIEISDMTFICVGTPSREDCSIDLSQVMSSCSNYPHMSWKYTSAG